MYILNICISLSLYIYIFLFSYVNPEVKPSDVHGQYSRKSQGEDDYTAAVPAGGRSSASGSKGIGIADVAIAKGAGDKLANGGDWRVEVQHPPHS